MPVVGARSQTIKSAPIIDAASKDAEGEFQLVHTEQHYARARQSATCWTLFFLGKHKVDSYSYGQEDYSLEN